MPRDGSIVPLFGVSTQGLSPVVTSQQRTNLYVHAPDGDKEGVKLYPRPGLVTFANASTLYGGPLIIRGLMDQEFVYTDLSGSAQTVAPIVCGATFGVIYPGYGGTSSLGAMLTDTGECAFTRNPTQVLVVDGRTGYIYTPTAGTLVSLEGLATAAWFPAGALSCCFLAGRFWANSPTTGRAYYSDLNDGLNGLSTQYVTAEADPDALVSVATDHGELLLFGEYTTEFWAPSSGTNPVSRVGGAALEWGLVARGSLKKVDGGMMFLGRNRLGDVRVLMLRGYQAVPISNPDIETQIQALDNLQGARAMAYTVNGHSFYVLTIEGKSFAYDMTSQTWSYVTTGTNDARWIGQHGSFLLGRYFVTDYRNTSIYTLEPEAYTDAGETIVREVVTRHTFADYDRTSVHKLGVDFETGVGLTSGRGVDPQVMLQVSRDNGRTWGNEVWQDLGALGDYVRRVWWTRLGRARDWLFRIRVSDPVKVVIAGGSLKVGR